MTTSADIVVQHRLAVVDADGSRTVEDAERWAEQNRETLRAALPEHGAVLVRGLGLPDPAAVVSVAGRLVERLMPELEGFARRTAHPGPAYSSAVWAPDTPMCMHHELSYASVHPATMVFGCLAVAGSGGEIELADAREMVTALPADLVEAFDESGWLLRRNYHALAGISWPEAFATDRRADVEDLARSRDIELQWLPGGHLRTTQRRRAVTRHQVTGDRCWFNSVAFLSRWTLDADVREYLETEFGPDGLPFDTAYGDGRPIGAAVVDTINSTYEQHVVRVEWRPGDLLLVDNVRMAHSRRPYRGNRDVVVAFADPLDSVAVDPRRLGRPDR